MPLEKLIDRRKTHSVKWYIEDQDMIPLCIADMDFQVSEEIVNAISQKAVHGIYGYSTFCERYYDAVQYWWNTQYDWELKREWISFSPGIIPGINLLLQALTQPGDAVIVQDPVYYPFFSTIETQGCTLLSNSLIYSNGTYTMNFEDFEEKASRPNTKIFILCSPHNPVGRVWTKEELRKIGEICEKHGVYVISDEMHGDLTYSGYKHTPFATVHPGHLKFSITCAAPSKTFNIAGMQSSIFIIPNKAVKEKYEKLLMGYGLMRPNAFAVEGTIAAYYKGLPWLEDVRSYLECNLQYVCSFLEQNIPSIKVVKPEATHLIWLDCRDLGIPHDELHHFFLEHARVRLDEGMKFGKGGYGFERINIACPREVLTEALLRMKAAVKAKETTC
ncbi:MalY/PatB family protein [Peribacillus frigoritolerans]|uniref:MalY/PatB family protein n=1 Tax=Peribacillus frigoritolerans TaxID=450367 RepID=UPI001059BB8F|nr:MalY/PatB family protein [Peribacillus frigoritolerans]TDL80494.1 pyridoxal phosphate-dependent aminotransferase [Peribacillus frigoritolerans]